MNLYARNYLLFKTFHLFIDRTFNILYYFNFTDFLVNYWYLYLLDDLHQFLALNYPLANHLYYLWHLDYLLYNSRNTYDLFNQLYYLHYLWNLNNFLDYLINANSYLFYLFYVSWNFHDFLNTNVYRLFLDDIFVAWHHHLA